MIINFKEEILSALKSYHFEPRDIDFVKGTSVTDRCVYETGERFLQDADFEYDNQDDTVDIDLSLVIVMKDRSYFTRKDKNDKEFFVYHGAPPKPSLEGVICLAPQLPMKRNIKIREAEEKITQLQEEIVKLKNVNYTFMEDK